MTTIANLEAAIDNLLASVIQLGIGLAVLGGVLLFGWLLVRGSLGR